MKRRNVQVNLLLLGPAALWVYLLADNWGRFEDEGHPSAPGPEVVSAASPRPASRATASDAAAIADYHLFHPDRHNDLPEEAVEEQEGKLRPAPVLMGTMGIGGDSYALMVSRGSRSSRGLYRRLRAGEVLDGYTLLRVEGDRVVMKVGDTEVRVGIDDRPKRSARPARSAGAAPRPRTSGAPRPPTGVGSPNRRPAAAARRPVRSSRTPASRTLPEGTVRDGKRLVIISTPFGDIRRWEKVKPE